MAFGIDDLLETAVVEAAKETVVETVKEGVTEAAGEIGAESFTDIVEETSEGVLGDMFSADSFSEFGEEYFSDEIGSNFEMTETGIPFEETFSPMDFENPTTETSMNIFEKKISPEKFGTKILKEALTLQSPTESAVDDEGADAID